MQSVDQTVPVMHASFPICVFIPPVVSPFVLYVPGWRFPPGQHESIDWLLRGQTEDTHPSCTTCCIFHYPIALHIPGLKTRSVGSPAETLFFPPHGHTHLKYILLKTDALFIHTSLSLANLSLCPCPVSCEYVLLCFFLVMSCQCLLLAVKFLFNRCVLFIPVSLGNVSLRWPTCKYPAYWHWDRFMQNCSSLKSLLLGFTYSQYRSKYNFYILLLHKMFVVYTFLCQVKD